MFQQIKKQIYVCVGVVKNKDGKYLLVKRREEVLPDAHDKWELPGGKVAFGETPEEALQREIYEETGYTVRVKSLLPHPSVSFWKYPSVYQHTIILGFVCELKDGLKQDKKHDHHVSEVSWYTVEEIQQLDTLPGVKNFIVQV